MWMHLCFTTLISQGVHLYYLYEALNTAIYVLAYLNEMHMSISQQLLNLLNSYL